MIVKYPGVGGLFVTMAMDDDISCPLLEAERAEVDLNEYDK
jgi:hypothetical protein